MSIALKACGGLALIAVGFTLGWLSNRVHITNESVKASFVKIQREKGSPEIKNANKAEGGIKNLEEPSSLLEEDLKQTNAILFNLVSFYKPDIFDFNSLTVSGSLIAALELSEEDVKKVNTALSKHLDSLKQEEKKHSQIITKPNGDQVISVSPYNSETIRQRLFNELASSIPSPKAAFLQSVIDQTNLFGKFGKYQIEISAENITTNMVMKTPDESPVSVLFQLYDKNNKWLDSSSSSMSIKTYKDRYGLLIGLAN